MRHAIASVLLLGLAACGSEQTQSGPTVAELQLKACKDVRDGIAAFNQQDYPATVAKFEEAERSAQAFAAESQTQDADDLLEAVSYYAELPADDYPDAARSSRDFAKYKSITLGQCTDGAPLDEPSDNPTLT